jgi:hypothetical protein
MPATGLADVKVGDPLILSTSNCYRGDEPVTVTRIGSKYLYVTRASGFEMRERFHRDNGVEDSQYGARSCLYTPAQYDELKQRSALFEQLRTAGIEFRYGVGPALATDQLRALLAIVSTEGAPA